MKKTLELVLEQHGALKQGGRGRPWMTVTLPVPVNTYTFVPTWYSPFHRNLLYPWEGYLRTGKAFGTLSDIIPSKPQTVHHAIVTTFTCIASLATFFSPLCNLGSSILRTL